MQDSTILQDLGRRGIILSNHNFHRKTTDYTLLDFKTNT